MDAPVKILIVENSQSDVDLMISQLRRSGFDPEWHIVETEEEFLAELKKMPDIILSNDSVPQFSGIRATELLQKSGLKIPLVFISGSFDESHAVAALKSGATDFLLKSRVEHLGTTVERALRAIRFSDMLTGPTKLPTFPISERLVPKNAALDIFNESLSAIMANTLRALTHQFIKHDILLNVFVDTTTAEHPNLTLATRFKKSESIAEKDQVLANIFVPRLTPNNSVRLLIARQCYRLLLELDAYLQSGRETWKHLPTTTEIEGLCDEFAYSLCGLYGSFGERRVYDTAKIPLGMLNPHHFTSPADIEAADPHLAWYWPDSAEFIGLVPVAHNKPDSEWPIGFSLPPAIPAHRSVNLVHITKAHCAALVWDEKLETEFRKLAADEAMNTILSEHLVRLEELNKLRNQFNVQLSAKSELLKRRHENLVEKMAETIREYVQFHKSTNPEE